mmetsp:Transcript_7523/g.13816  ORF Transcript_7523/g.13816 Transcript_7523/m.13816 type:complete len:96 (+) Transcript_7523:692-979(+)
MFLGKSKPLMQLLTSSLDLSYEKACRFLGTYCVQKAYRLSVKEMYNETGTKKAHNIGPHDTRRVHGCLENDCKWWYLWRRKKPEAILAKVSRPHE